MMKKILISTVVVLSILSCKENNNTDNTDRRAILDNLGNIAFNYYKEFDAATDSLIAKTDSFTANISLAGLNELRTAYKNACIAYQKAQVCNIGRAEEISFIGELNFFPERADFIQSAIQSGNYNMNTIDSKAKGFPALDYLLYAVNNYTDNELVEWYKTNANARNYIKAVIGKIKAISEDVYTTWENGYLETFKSRQGIDRSSSLFLLVNAYLENFETQCRTAQVGLPLGYNGIFDNNTPRIDDIEARHSQLSLELLKAHFQAIENIYKGGNGFGLDDYLDQMDARYNNKQSTYNGELLSVFINDLFANAHTAINALQEPYAQEIINNRQKVVDVFTALQHIIATFKIDVASAMSIDIIYQDSDGD
jgi:predicted lipoprotein